MAPGTIRMSAEEKKVKIIEIFHETLKEIEKLAAKKGVVEKTVKDIVQLLVADGLIQSDKIGSSNFFWAFPSAQGAALMNQLRNLEAENASLTFQIDKFSHTIQLEQSLRIQTPERESALASYTALQADLVALKTELERYGECEGGEVERKKRAEHLTKEAALRWTENVDMARDHFYRVFALNKEEMDVHFGIGNDWDELENM